MQTNKTIREFAIEWWSRLPNRDKLTDKYFIDREESSLTGREIEKIYLAEHRFIELEGTKYKDLASYINSIQKQQSQKEIKKLKELNKELVEALEMMVWAALKGEYESAKQGKPRLVDRHEICNKLLKKAKNI